MITRTKTWIANFIVLGACIYLAFVWSHLGYTILLYIITAFTMNGMIISENLYRAGRYVSKY